MALRWCSARHGLLSHSKASPRCAAAVATAKIWSRGAPIRFDKFYNELDAWSSVVQNNCSLFLFFRVYWLQVLTVSWTFFTFFHLQQRKSMQTISNNYIMLSTPYQNSHITYTQELKLFGKTWCQGAWLAHGPMRCLRCHGHAATLHIAPSEELQCMRVSCSYPNIVCTYTYI